MSAAKESKLRFKEKKIKYKDIIEAYQRTYHDIDINKVHEEKTMLETVLNQVKYNVQELERENHL